MNTNYMDDDFYLQTLVLLSMSLDWQISPLIDVHPNFYGSLHIVYTRKFLDSKKPILVLMKNLLHIIYVEWKYYNIYMYWPVCGIVLSLYFGMIYIFLYNIQSNQYTKYFTQRWQKSPGVFMWPNNKVKPLQSF